MPVVFKNNSLAVNSLEVKLHTGGTEILGGTAGVRRSVTMIMMKHS